MTRLCSDWFAWLRLISGRMSYIYMWCKTVVSFEFHKLLDKADYCWRSTVHLHLSSLEEALHCWRPWLVVITKSIYINANEYSKVEIWSYRVNVKLHGVSYGHKTSSFQLKTKCVILSFFYTSSSSSSSTSSSSSSASSSSSSTSSTSSSSSSHPEGQTRSCIGSRHSQQRKKQMLVTK